MFAAFTIPLALLLLTLVTVSVANLLYHGFDKAGVEASTVWRRHFGRTFPGLLVVGILSVPFGPSYATTWAVMLAGAVSLPVGLLAWGTATVFADAPPEYLCACLPTSISTLPFPAPGPFSTSF